MADKKKGETPKRLSDGTATTCPHLGLARLPGPLGAYLCVEPTCGLVFLIQNPILIPLEGLGLVGQQLTDGVKFAQDQFRVQRNLKAGLLPSGLVDDKPAGLVLPFPSNGNG